MMNASVKLVVVLELFGQAKNDECISETRRRPWTVWSGQKWWMHLWNSSLPLNLGQKWWMHLWNSSSSLNCLVRPKMMNASLKLVAVLELFGQAKNDECISELVAVLELFGQAKNDECISETRRCLLNLRQKWWMHLWNSSPSLNCLVRPKMMNASLKLVVAFEPRAKNDECISETRRRPWTVWSGQKWWMHLWNSSLPLKPRAKKWWMHLWNSSSSLNCLVRPKMMNASLKLAVVTFEPRAKNDECTHSGES